MEGKQTVTRLRRSLSIALVAGALWAPAAQADIIGSLVNAVMEKLLYGKPAPVAPPVVDYRNIPEAANVGVMSPPEGRQVYIDGKEMWLAPGSRIRDLNNRIIRPGTLEEPVNVRYTLDQNEQVHHVWLLAER